MSTILVRDIHNASLVEFLEHHDFFIEEIGNYIYQVNRSGELPVYLHEGDKTIYFEADLGSIKDISSKELLYQLLDLNTVIMPVSVGINTENKDDPRLVLVESRERENLDSNELLSVFDSFELATDKVTKILTPFIY